MDKTELVFLEPGKADAEPFTTSEVIKKGNSDDGL